MRARPGLGTLLVGLGLVLASVAGCKPPPSPPDAPAPPLEPQVAPQVAPQVTRVVHATPEQQGAYVISHDYAEPTGEVPDRVGTETLSTGEQVDVVIYVHTYPQPVESYPRVWYAGRWYYNVHGNLVFWDPFFGGWVFYWGPPVGLVYSWNLYYPWMSYHWGVGFYGPGWYWGGVAVTGWHAYGRYPGHYHPGRPYRVPRPAHAARPATPPDAGGRAPTRPSRSEPAARSPRATQTPATPRRAPTSVPPARQPERAPTAVPSPRAPDRAPAVPRYAPPPDRKPPPARVSPPDPGPPARAKPQSPTPPARAKPPNPRPPTRAQPPSRPPARAPKPPARSRPPRR